ncbi:hypothetical protein FHS18_000359 [Paenibacillus phyllosphaerae]|uniref:Uncharacterized protein n=1 Tax=Paenibacillus phyllosphaerae TaxID=274593 RepID=A0A7W5AU56_9BACL|nr:hypothetical protein [Paenibacillus phyllosphaerae]
MQKRRDEKRTLSWKRLFQSMGFRIALIMVAAIISARRG